MTLPKSARVLILTAGFVAIAALAYQFSGSILHGVPKPQKVDELYAAGYSVSELKSYKETAGLPTDAESDEILLRLKSLDYDALEKFASSYRVQGVTTAKGNTKIMEYYALVGFAGTESRDGTPWETRLTQLESWALARPASVTPRVALMVFWKNYAWDARGAAYANKTSEAQFRLFSERLAKARAVAIELGERGFKCPHFFSIILTIGTGAGFDAELEGGLYAKGRSLYPDYQPMHNAYSMYLLPRWHGADLSDWLNSIGGVSGEMNQTDGDILYARSVVWGDSMGEESVDLWRDGCIVNWPKLERGMRAIIAKYPDSVWAKAQLCSYYANKGMHEQAQALFKELGPVYVPDVWPTPRSFLNARHLMFSKCGAIGPEHFKKPGN